MGIATAFPKIRRIAETQNGLITGEQILELGETQSTIWRGVQSGAWEEIGPDVYLMFGSPTTSVLLQAAVLALPGAVVSHQSAAKMQNLGWEFFSEAVVTVPTRRTHAFQDAQVHQSTDLDPQYIANVGGLPVTTPIRTLFDLAWVTSLPYLRSITQKALAAQKVQIDDLFNILEKLGRRGRPGTVRFRKLLEEVEPGFETTESDLEEKFLALLQSNNLPAPISQMPLPWRDITDGRVDFAYKDHKLIIECDGRRWHTTMEAFDRDRNRDNQAQLHGWILLRFTWRDITANPAQVVEQVKQALQTD